MIRMVEVEGYKAFHGDMRVEPRNKLYPSFYICDKDWLFKPDTGCWYGNVQSFPEEICTLIEKESSDE